MTAFVFVAGFTPAMTAFTYQVVTDTSETATDTISSSFTMMEASNTLISSSQSMRTNLESIRQHQDRGQISEAVTEAGRLSGNFNEFDEAYSDISMAVSYSSNEDLESELDRVSRIKSEIDTQISTIIASARTNTSVTDDQLDSFRDNIHRLSQSSSRINDIIISDQRSDIQQLNSSLEELGFNIVMMGVSFMFIAVPIAYYCSLIISRPIKELSVEARKVKKENLEDVDVDRIETRADELRKLKEVISRMVLTLRAEFRRESPEMNRMGLDIAEKLSEEVPRGTAESSVVSACEKLDIDPLEIDDGDLEDIAEQLRVSMGGLHVDQDVFDEIEEM